MIFEMNNAFLTCLHVEKAKELVESAPCVLLKAVKKADAEEFVKVLKAVGGEVVLE
jgi:ribosomal protein L7/L12